jgi:abortive infection bacteriophage resistance protein
MGSKATKVEEQIKKLSDRGMVFEENGGIEKAKEILLDVGYYRLGFYWYYFHC